jgi:lipoprotein-releasing system ATP-binding protein
MLTAENLSKTYRRNADTVRVLNGVSLTVHDGEFLSIVGASGSGKSTLLHVLGTLDTADSGTIALDGRRLDNLAPRERDAIRNRTFGYVFQFYHLLPELSAYDNALMPAYIANSLFGWMKARKHWRKRADELFERVGLSHRKTHKPRELSGGEMQRCAIARALLQHPRVLLADEPTGNLDAEKGNEILDLLHDLNRRDRVTIIMVTHNLEMAGTTHRTVRLVGGRVAEEKGPTFRPRLMQAAV